MSCLSIIRAARNGMSANEKKLADFVLENASLIRDYSSQQIAGAVGVSQSSVVKFSQKLGYKGFTDLKLAVHESVLVQGNSLALIRGDSDGDEAEPSEGDWLSALKRDALDSAVALNSNDKLLDAVARIEAANRVQVVGTGAANLVAKDLSYKLIALGKPVIAESDQDVQMSGVALLERKDCVIVLSAKGQSQHLLTLAKLARKSGATIISVTNQWVNPLSAIADIRLFSVTSDGRPDINQLIESASQQHLVDLIYVALLQRSRRHKTDALPELWKRAKN